MRPYQLLIVYRNSAGRIDSSIPCLYAFSENFLKQETLSIVVVFFFYSNNRKQKKDGKNVSH